jgi:hypothetical protein
MADIIPAGQPSFRFRPLHGQEIRVLYLQPAAEPEDGIECVLYHVQAPTRQTATPTEGDQPLQPHGYEALSYRLGSSHLKKEILVCDDWTTRMTRDPSYVPFRSFAVTSSLAAALRQLRRPSEPRVLWVDQICINQRDDAEKSAQIDLMGSIYKHAHNVIVWLGEIREEDDPDWENISSRPHDAEKAVAISFQAMSRPEADVGREEGHVGRVRRGFEILFSRPWFQRTWVIQEVTLPASQDVILRCGQHESLLDNLHLVLEHGLVFSKQSRSYRGLTQASRLLELRSELQKAKPGPARLLLALRLYAGWFYTTDIRDRYCGLLGLLGSDGGSPSSRFDESTANLRRSVTDKTFFTELAADLIERFGACDILDGASGPYTPEVHVPSWVPLWHVRMASLPFAQHCRRDMAGLAQATVAGGRLTLRGLPLGSILWMAPLCHRKPWVAGEKSLSRTWLHEDAEACNSLENVLIRHFEHLPDPISWLSLALGGVPASSSDGMRRLCNFLPSNKVFIEPVLHALVTESKASTQVIRRTVRDGFDKLATYVQSKCSMRCSDRPFREMAGVALGREADWGADGPEAFEAQYLEMAQVFITSSCRVGYTGQAAS